MVKVIGPLRSHWASGSISAPRVYSSSLRNRKDRKAPPVPPPPEHDYILTGDITPDATGYYDEAGTYNSKPYYARTDNAWFIWWHPPFSAWLITISPGNYSNSWYRIAEDVLGQYTAYGVHLGNPILSGA